MRRDEQIGFRPSVRAAGSLRWRWTPCGRRFQWRRAIPNEHSEGSLGRDWSEHAVVWFQGGLSGPVIVCHRYDYVPLFVATFDIPESLSRLLQGIASVYDRSQLSRLRKLLQEDDILNVGDCVA